MIVVVLAVWWLMAGGDGGQTAAARPFDEVLAEAVDLGRSGRGDEAVALLERYMETAKGDDWRRGQTALSEMTAAVSVDRATEFWSRYKAAELAGFQEKGRLPEVCWLEAWGRPIATPEIEDVWRSTLERDASGGGGTFGEPASARADRAPGFCPSTIGPTRPKPRRPRTVDSRPAEFYGKLVYFDDARLDASMAQEPGQGFLLSVTGAAGDRFPARADGDKLVFAHPEGRLRAAQVASGGRRPDSREALLPHREGQKDGAQRPEDVPQGDGVQAGAVPVAKGVRIPFSPATIGYAGRLSQRRRC